MSKELEEFPKIKPLYAVLLTIITSGIYIPYWFLSRRKNLERCQIKLPYVAIKVTAAVKRLFNFGAFLDFLFNHISK
nr:hypothetical protein [Bacillus licheniformis]